ncbi:hypothetical protein G8S55_06470 [Clostridium botulinum C]|uniref:hypothetical protein n=1 Tax=Clostridium botulinum TaxID=1491 RepID=UPI001E2DD329|nr:hypothetical protein [Clostridium botulinum]MCD3216897.1 hypothetical protein [Clostridium botulinum C]
MNKFDVKIPDSDNEIISLYFNCIEEVLDYCDKNLTHHNITKDNITKDTKLEYMEYVNDIISNSEDVVFIKNKKHYLYKSRRGLIPVNLWEEGGFYFDGCQYIEGRYDVVTKTVKPFQDTYITIKEWTYSNPKEFLDIFKSYELEFKEDSVRTYGQPKLIRPKELKGVKQAFSVDYIRNKCKCQVFVKDNDVWIKHKDYFSPSLQLPNEDIGMSLGYLCEKYVGKKRSERFIYADSWGDIILRNEAWICIKNLVYRIKIGEFPPYILNDILRQQEKLRGLNQYELCSSYMDRFWENVIAETKKYITQNNYRN